MSRYTSWLKLNNSHRLACIYAALFTTFFAAPVHAGGVYLYEIGTEDVGLASAGVAARAQDASVMAFNPAGLTRLEGDQMTLGVQALYGDVNLRLNNGDSPDDSVIGWFPGASGFYSHSVDDKLKVGVGMYGNFGLGLDFGQWDAGTLGVLHGNNIVKKATSIGLTFQPTVAYKLNEQWSLGASLGLNYGLFSVRSDEVLTGNEKLKKDYDWALNAKLGVLYELDTATRFGLAYTSKTEFNYDNMETVLGSFSAQVNAPQNVMFSAYHQLNSTWAVMGNLGWQDWSTYDAGQISVGPASSTLGQGLLQDTWHAAVGAQYQLNPAWRLNAGMAYDSSVYQSQDQGLLLLPAGDTWRFGVGAQYALDKQSNVGVAAEYARIDSSAVPAVNGSYDTGHLYFLSANYSRRF